MLSMRDCCKAIDNTDDCLPWLYPLSGGVNAACQDLLGFLRNVVKLQYRHNPQDGDTCQCAFPPVLLELWAVQLTQSMMELTGEPPHNNNTPAGNEPPACGLHSKRLKELENAALQTSLISQMETESGADAGSWAEQQQQQPGQGEQPNGLPLNQQRAAPPQLVVDTEAEGAQPETNAAKQRVEEERTLTDHLNKRLLSSFLEKLNERDLALPGVQRLDCAVAEEDSNRAADEW